MVGKQSIKYEIDNILTKQAIEDRLANPLCLNAKRQEETVTSYTERSSLYSPSYIDCIISVNPRRQE